MPHRRRAKGLSRRLICGPAAQTSCAAPRLKAGGLLFSACASCPMGRGAAGAVSASCGCGAGCRWRQGCACAPMSRGCAPRSSRAMLPKCSQILRKCSCRNRHRTCLCSLRRFPTAYGCLQAFFFTLRSFGPVAGCPRADSLVPCRHVVGGDGIGEVEE